MPRYVAVTGCAGFIGRHVTSQLLARGDYVYGIDCLTYAADPTCIERFQHAYPETFHFRPDDIRSLGRFPDIDAVVHLAAETHVDNSLTEAARFVDVNVNGTQHLLEMCLAKRQHGSPRFVYVSTDEVYGPVELSRHGDGKAQTTDRLAPSSPYAASKAAADLLVQAYGTTFGVPYTILRPTNCYGVGQYPEKLIPKAVRSLTLGRPIPIHGDGSQTRSWLWVEDCADAIVFALDYPDVITDDILNVGGNTEASARDVASVVIEVFRSQTNLGDRSPEQCLEAGYSRPGGDQRYAVNDTPLRNAGWTPQGNLWHNLPWIVEVERRRFRW